MRVRTLTALLFLVLMAPAITARSPNDSNSSELVWPPPPDPPRIRYIDTLRGEDQYKKKPSAWRRLLLGPEQDEGIQLKKPYGVVTDTMGRIYVSDTGLGAVVVFDPHEKDVHLLGNTGRVRLVTPIGMAVDEKGRLFVSDASLDTVFCFDEREEVVLALGRKEGLQNPAGIVVDRARHRLYVADSHLHAVHVYSTDGVHLGSWGTRGSGDGQFNFPTNLSLDEKGNLYVVDTGNFRVQMFDPDGNFRSSFGRAGDGFGSFHRPKGVALDSEGHIYVVDAAFNNFQVFDPEGHLLLFVGATGREPGTFWLPAGIHIDGRDRIFVVDQVNRRVQVFEYLGG